jgi:hypothetical protein
MCPGLSSTQRQTGPCLDKRHQSHSWPNRKQQSSENQEEPMMVCADSLKLLLGELGASPVARDMALSRSF